MKEDAEIATTAINAHKRKKMVEAFILMSVLIMNWCGERVRKNEILLLL